MDLKTFIPNSFALHVLIILVHHRGLDLFLQYIKMTFCGKMNLILVNYLYNSVSSILAGKHSFKLSLIFGFTLISQRLLSAR